MTMAISCTTTSPHRSSSPEIKPKNPSLFKRKMFTRKPAGAVSRFKIPLNGAMLVKKVEKVITPSDSQKVVRASTPRGSQNVKKACTPNGSQNVKKPSTPSGCQKVEKATNSRKCVDQNSPVMKRAFEFQKTLPNFPNFVKLMLHSHVRGGFWLGLSKSFTDANLPKEDVTVVLIDEHDREYKTNYLSGKTGLSGGWRGFAIDHNLNEGDVLIFQLIKPCEFKVYIVKKNDVTETDSLLQLDSEDTPIAIEYPKSRNNDLGSDVMEGISFSESDIEFNELKSFNSFKILINGLPIDSEVSESIRVKYYELCLSQKSLIHERCVSGLNAKEAAEIILEIVNIANAIRLARLTTRCDFKTWDRTLAQFENLGMGVGFLRERMRKLIRIASKHQSKMKLKEVKYAEKEEEMRVLEEELLKVKNEIKKLNSEMKAIEREGDKRLEVNFEEVAMAQW